MTDTNIKILKKSLESRGYIALMSTLVISFILSAVVLAGSFESFFSRQNVLNRELKEMSFSLAEGCLQKAVLVIRQSPNFKVNEHNETLFSDLEKNLLCTLKSLERDAAKITINVQAKALRAETNLEAVFDEDSLEVTQLKEL